MSNIPSAKRKKVISHYINENLTEVFHDYADDRLPDQLVDMLNVLRAQDEELNKGGK